MRIDWQKSGFTVRRYTLQLNAVKAFAIATADWKKKQLRENRKRAVISNLSENYRNCPKLSHVIANCSGDHAAHVSH